MTEATTVVVAEYRARGLDEADEDQIRSELEVFGPVRLRPLDLPEAGGSFEIWLVVHFIGTAALSGIIGHVVSNYYDRLSAALGRFFSGKYCRTNYYPEMTLKVTYDELDLDFGPLDQVDLETLPATAASVMDHLTKHGLRGRPVTRIVTGMVQDQEGWSEPHLQNPSADHRYWGISLETHRSITHIYDTHTHLLSEQLSNRPRGA